ncbi:MAG TPA: hypothetical protein ENN67_01500, partial [Firmicutes bacterium]|nr:hypothetical protein [Bacillota bacterium]
LVDSVDREYLVRHNYPGANVPVTEWSGKTLLIDLMAARYILTPFEFSSASAGDGRRFGMVDRGPMLVYVNRRAFPRAWIARPERIIDETPQTLHQLRNGDLNPIRSLMLSPMPERRIVYPDGTQGIASARIRYGRGAGLNARGGAIRDETLIIDVDCPQDAYLVLADTHYPGWVAEVDGQPATIYRAFGYFRAVQIPAGEHIVAFYYRPLTFSVGKTFSLITLATYLLLLLVQVFFFSKSKPDTRRD